MNGIIFLPPRCPKCSTGKPNEISQQGDETEVYQCVNCGHVWEPPQGIPAKDIQLEYSYIPVFRPIQRKRLNGD